jgi:hypothetical protein
MTCRSWAEYSFYFTFFFVVWNLVALKILVVDNNKAIESASSVRLGKTQELGAGGGCLEVSVAQPDVTRTGETMVLAPDLEAPLEETQGENSSEPKITAA